MSLSPGASTLQFAGTVAVQPPRLIVPQAPVESPIPGVLGAVLMILSVTLLAASCIGIGVWRHDRKRMIEPSERAFLAYAKEYALSSAQRETARRIAGHLGPDVPPVALLLSRAALRRAVAMELEHKPEPRAVRELQRLVEKLVGDIESGPARELPPSAPARASVAAPGAKPVVRRKQTGT
jgi:hypothetical protein